MKNKLKIFKIDFSAANSIQHKRLNTFSDYHKNDQKGNCYLHGVYFINS